MLANNKTTKLHSMLLIGVLFYASLIKASEQDIYDFFWLDTDKKVFVLQNKYFKNKNKFFLSVGYNINTSNNYFNTTGESFTLSYYTSETFAIELEYQVFNSKENTSFSNLKLINNTIPFVRNNLSYSGLNFLFTPFYGKINTFNKIFYFDWGLGLGVGNIKIKSNADTVAYFLKENTFSEEKSLSFKLKTYLKINISKKTFVNLGYEKIFYRANGIKDPQQGQSKTLYTSDNILFNIGMSF